MFTANIREQIPHFQINPKKNKINNILEFHTRCCIIALVKDEKNSSGSIKIDPDVHKKVSDYCREHGIKVTFFATQAISEKLERVENVPRETHPQNSAQ